MSKRTDVLAGIGGSALVRREMDSTVGELLTTSRSTAELAEQVAKTRAAAARR